MEILAGTSRVLGREVMDAADRYRHRVFVQRLGWPLNSTDGLERDQFDDDNTLYLVCRNRHGEVVGSARLLTTTGAYLLADVFPVLMGGQPAPRRADIFELSRFAAVDFASPSRGSLAQFSSDVAIELLHAVLEVAADRGAARLITVSPLGVERLLRSAGFSASRAAKPVRVDDQMLFACWIECAQKTHALGIAPALSQASLQSRSVASLS